MPTQFSNCSAPDVSVIIPTYNRLAMLKEALASVFAQCFEGSIEVIVIDDNSQDQTAEFVRQTYPDIRLISLKQNGGSYAARNQGLAIAKGKYIALLDSDDLWESNYLQSQIMLLAAQERGFAICPITVWYTLEDYKFVKLQQPNLEDYPSVFHQLLAAGSFISTPSSVVFPSALFDQIGNFDEVSRLGGDTDLYIRCLLAGYQPIFNTQPLTIWRKHGKGQATDVKNLAQRSKSRLMRANKFYPEIAKRIDIVPLRQIRAEIYSNLAKSYFRQGNFFDWFLTTIDSAKHASLRRALHIVRRDIRYALQHH
ncbi:MAG: glycosyltransferase [Cyanothece sp. SIO1E1]|nr:glycosyltransferase [Cyanothece sp. SIO1E1]